MPKPITLADALVSLRKDLETAREAGEKQDLKFTVEDVEVEFQISASTEISGKGSGKLGAGFWTLNLEGGGKKSDQATHKIKLKLKPIPADGKELEISAKGRKPK